MMARTAPARAPHRFFLHGIEGCYNYGCEAIIRGTVEILACHFPGVPVVYLSRRPAEDAAALEGCDLQIRDNRRRPVLHPGRMLGAVSRRAGLPVEVLLERVRDLTPEDCLLSIGGDLFALPLERRPRRAHLPHVQVAQYCVRRGIPVVLWGASVGPFDASPGSVLAYRRLLSGLSLITIREPATCEYLGGLGLRGNMATVADPAFLMRAAGPEDDFPFAAGDGPVIGVNLSALSVRVAHGGDAVCEARQAQVQFLQWLAGALGARLLLIPHVVAPGPQPDDDWSYLGAVYGELTAGMGDGVALLPRHLGARRTKAAIAQCDLLLASRMHCAIAGVSGAVPTLFLSYSQKAIGMARFVYGHSRWCVEVSRMCSPAGKAVVGELAAACGEVRQQLLGERDRFDQHARSAGEALARVLCEAWGHGPNGGAVRRRAGGEAGVARGQVGRGGKDAPLLP